MSDLRSTGLHESPAAGDHPFVSIIVPTRNEERYIEQCLDSIIATSYPTDRLEVIVADGRSDDRTRAIVQRYVERHSWIRLIDNPGRTAPAALNAGIRLASGDLIVRMDGHAMYPPHYLARLVAAIAETGADNVGGRLVTLPADSTPMARAIARALSHPFGVGNSHFRIGARKRRWVDTVPFGCFRREVFGRVGMFDEELVRNQDDEFNFRLTRRGGRVLLDPAIVAFYHARASLRQVARMYYQYGYFKPLVARKVGRIMTVRQLVPPAFVASVTTTGVGALLEPIAAILFTLVLGTYATALLGGAARAAYAEGLRFAIALLAVFATLHASYGIGFLRGAWDMLRGRRVSNDSSMTLSRG
jgi:GT2 family glycosyltransferase